MQEIPAFAGMTKSVRGNDKGGFMKWLLLMPLMLMDVLVIHLALPLQDWPQWWAPPACWSVAVVLLAVNVVWIEFLRESEL